MSISSSIYIGTTGMIAHQEQMSVISDNIANMNTVGFKSSRMLFSTLISEQLPASTLSNQVGQGVGISSIHRDMTVGALEPTNAATDLSIAGSGFFIVSPDTTDAVYYSRAGSFRFDKDGYLRDPQGNVLQGYRLPVGDPDDAEANLPKAASARLQDIILSTDEGGMAVSDPEATTEIQMLINLNSSSADRSSDPTSPFTSLFDSWDATQDEPLAANAYSYSSQLKIYDEAGQGHVLSVYFDPVDELSGDTNGNRVWEFVAAIPPGEDASGLSAKKGIAMTGTLTFTPAGELLSMSAFSGTSDDKSSWRPVAVDANGFPVLTATVTGAAPISSALNFGISSSGGGWSMPAGVATLDDLGTDFANLPNMLDPDRQVLGMTNFSTGSSTLSQSQNGYARGILQTVSVDSGGTMIGNFSNGQIQALYKIPLADFINPQGLYREGGNLFSSTKDSGGVILGWANEGRLGEVVSSSLENSNVDLATEFVNMIISQKGFDANSKVITTSDQVVQTAIQMKK
jgi:flagellar hook protein FlgE